MRDDNVDGDAGVHEDAGASGTSSLEAGRPVWRAPIIVTLPLTDTLSGDGSNIDGDGGGASYIPTF